MKKKQFKILVLTFLLAAMGLGFQTMAKAKGQLTGEVNVNEATIEQITMLPGVGLQRAKLIQEYAKAHPFKSPEELKGIKGIGDKSFEKLRPFVTVSGPTTAKWVDTPSKE